MFNINVSNNSRINI